VKNNNNDTIQFFRTLIFFIPIPEKKQTIAGKLIEWFSLQNQADNIFFDLAPSLMYHPLLVREKVKGSACHLIRFFTMSPTRFHII
jgi:hypothetical protein